MSFQFPISDGTALVVPDANLIGAYGPAPTPTLMSEGGTIAEGLACPIGCSGIADLVGPGSRVLILCDDKTRPTPVKTLLPPIIAAAQQAGVRPANVQIIIAIGSHSDMTDGEIRSRIGDQCWREHASANHNHLDSSNLTSLGTSTTGVELWVNKTVAEADVVIGVGSIKPHMIGGFSGGAKIVLPGVAGKVTIRQAHLLEFVPPPEFVYATTDAPFRRTAEEMAVRAGLNLIVNAVLHPDGSILRLCVGAYGTHLPCQADVVISDLHPTGRDLFTAAEPIHRANLAVREGGAVVLLAPELQARSTVFPELLDWIGLDDSDQSSLVDPREIAASDLQMREIVAAFCVLRLPKLAKRAAHILVAPHISQQQKRKLGFIHAETGAEALEMAFEHCGRLASVCVLREAGRVLPVVGHTPAERATTYSLRHQPEALRPGSTDG